MRTVTADGAPDGPFARTYDLLGDGRLVIAPTPGHTPGHVGMIVRGATRLWLLAGKVTRWRDYFDPIAVFEAVGWPPRA